MTETRGFEINGEALPIPPMATFDNDECRIFWLETGHTVEEFFLEEISYAELFKIEGFMPALAKIAYRRAHPEIEDDELRTVIGKTNRLALVGQVLSAMNAAANAEAEAEAKGKDEPATSGQPQPSRSSSSENESSSGRTLESSGNGSEKSTEAPADDPAIIGTLESDTPSTFPPRSLVV